MIFFDYIPIEIPSKKMKNVMFLVRKRILHKGYQLSYRYIQYNDIYNREWTLYNNYLTKNECLNVINNLIKI